MAKDIERICKNCFSWIPVDYEFFPSSNLTVCQCESSKIWSWIPTYASMQFDDAFVPHKYPEMGAFCTGPNFGCIHFKARP